MSAGPTILLAAGGTGGHLFPAQALALELGNRGYAVELISDERVSDFASSFPARAIHQVTSGTVTGGGFIGKVKGVVKLGRGIFECRSLLKRINPAVIVGFGGYPTVPPILAATFLRIPAVLHEQNAVMGRANRFLAGRVGRIATGFDIDKAGKGFVHVGNPVRANVIAAAKLPMPALSSDGILRLLVFGGSQGARVMGDIVPPAIDRLPHELRQRLHITQQVREEDRARVIADYARMNVQAECAAFFSDLPRRMAESHLVIARSGASTVAELAMIGRASLLVPLPGSLDQDQAANARVLADAGGAEIMMQPNFTPEALAERLGEVLRDPQHLIAIAAKAKAMGIPDAASRLADVTLSLAGLPLSHSAISGLETRS